MPMKNSSPGWHTGCSGHAAMTHPFPTGATFCPHWLGHLDTSLQSPGGHSTFDLWQHISSRLCASYFREKGVTQKFLPWVLGLEVPCITKLQNPSGNKTEVQHMARVPWHWCHQRLVLVLTLCDHCCITDPSSAGTPCSQPELHRGMLQEGTEPKWSWGR